jgi:parallel beta-helix repeat protein
VSARPVRAARLVGAVLLVAGAVAGCGGGEGTPFVPREAPPRAVVDPAQPCTRQADLAASVSAPAPDPAPVPVAAVRDPATRAITVTAGTGFGLAELSRAVRDPAALREVEPGRWLLGADLRLMPGTAMRVVAPEVRWLGLVSAPGQALSIQVLGGSLDVVGACVTSWDEAAGRVDTEPADGRAYVLARDGGRLTVDHSEVRYLGYGAVESYGLSWRTAGTGGGLTHSVVSHLYFGLYTYQIDGLQVTDNEVHDSLYYGIDPHTASRHLVIERNVVHDNGKHGIILAEDCTDSVIRDNVVYRNAHHGIVLYLRSDRNVVEDNETFANTAHGINVNESAGNVVRGNRVYRNGESGIGVGQTSSGNVVERNAVLGNGQDGVRLVSEATDNAVTANWLGVNARYGVYVDTEGTYDIRGNSIFGSRIGVLLRHGTAEPSGNDLFDNRDGDVVQR